MLMLLLSLFAHADSGTAAERAVVKQLSQRHATVSCEALASTLASPTESFVRIAEQVSSPPWVSIRAASCATDRPDATPHLSRWVSMTEHAGLGRVVLQKIDVLPARLELAKLALLGPIAEATRTRLALSEHAELRVLLD